MGGGTAKLLKKMVNAAKDDETFNEADPWRKFLDNFLEKNGLKQWTAEELAEQEDARRNPESVDGYADVLEQKLRHHTEVNATRETENDALFGRIKDKIEELRTHIASAASDYS